MIIPENTAIVCDTSFYIKICCNLFGMDFPISKGKEPIATEGKGWYSVEYFEKKGYNLVHEGEWLLEKVMMYQVNDTEGGEQRGLISK